MGNGQNGRCHLGTLHMLYQQQPTDLDRRCIEIRQWLTAKGDYSDLIVEQGLQGNDSKTMVMPFLYSVDQALASLNGSGQKVK